MDGNSLYQLLIIYKLAFLPRNIPPIYSPKNAICHWLRLGKSKQFQGLHCIAMSNFKEQKIANVGLLKLILLLWLGRYLLSITLDRSWSTKGSVVSRVWLEKIVESICHLWEFPNFRGFLTIECLAHSICSQTQMETIAASNRIGKVFSSEIFFECTVYDGLVVNTLSLDKIVILYVAERFSCSFFPNS